MPHHSAGHSRGHAAVNGARIYYDCAGTGEPLLLIHTGNGSTEIWDRQVEELAARYRVIRFDLRGFGRSDLPPGPFLWPADARDLLAHLGVQRTHVLGASLGGRIAVELSLLAPDLVASLVLAAPVLREQSWRPELMQIREAENDSFVAGDFEAATESMMRAWVAGPHRTLTQVEPSVVTLLRRTQLASYQTRRPAELGPEPAGPELLLDPPAMGRLAEIAAPTLVLAGELDQPDCLEVARLLAEQIPDARLAVVPGAAHMLTLEQPRRFLDLTLGFLDAVAGPRAASPLDARPARQLSTERGR
jgi:3-oxoadipate enol-lactonase